MSSSYVTVQGDTFDLIAHKQLGDARLMSQVMELNPEYMDIVFFSAGIELTLPDVPVATTLLPQPPWK